MIINPYVFAAAGYNPLTLAWIDETGETDTTIIDALNTLEQGLIDNSLTSKILALYPMVGGTATKHKYNFMNTAAYQITFSGGITHSSTGVLFNGTNGNGDTGIVPRSVLTQFNSGFGYYSRTTTTPGSGEYIGSYDGSTILGFGRGVNTAYNIDVGSYIDLTTSYGKTFLVNRIANNSYSVWGDGITTSTSPKTILTSGVLPNTSLCFGTLSGSFFSLIEMAAGYVTDGLSDSEASTFVGLISAFQTTLSRNV